MLPKIHKPDIPGRPIISGCDSPTEKLSIYIDYHLKPLVPLIPSYIRDTKHFLSHIFSLPTPLPPDTLLATIDVTSLYTNIPHDEGIHASLVSLATHPDTTSRPPLHVFQQLFTYILKHNYFSFNNEFYLQQHGTAMGTRMAPSYANLFMSHLESLLLEHPPGNLLPLVWKRYIDDIFILWTHGSSTLQTFLNHINSFHPTIKFTYTTSPSSINFLDTRIHITSQQTLESSLYTKPTDNSLLLHHTSHHPLSCKLGTIFSQALRYRRLITQDEELHKQLNRLRLILLSRGYPNHTITSSFQKVSTLTQHQLLAPSTTTTNTSPNPIIPYSIPYHPSITSLPNIIRSTWSLISRDRELSSLFPKPPLVAYMRHKNLKDLLVHTHFSTSPSNSTHPSPPYVSLPPP
ncbi:hypothetical protein QZH41_006059 [Actinostola sp. cb2023]|nr:hypothetical protein QZH41_006059 [Actinostola sp. cb2023]